MPKTLQSVALALVGLHAVYARQGLLEGLAVVEGDPDAVADVGLDAPRQLRVDPAHVLARQHLLGRQPLVAAPLLDRHERHVHVRGRLVHVHVAAQHVALAVPVLEEAVARLEEPAHVLALQVRRSGHHPVAHPHRVGAHGPTLVALDLAHAPVDVVAPALRAYAVVLAGALPVYVLAAQRALVVPRVVVEHRRYRGGLELLDVGHGLATSST